MSKLKVKMLAGIQINVILLLLSLIQSHSSLTQTEEYTESLLIKPLSDGHLYAYFQFNTIWHKQLADINWANRFNLFPLSFGKLIAKHELQELHFSLTKGVWKHSRWGYPIRDSPSGAQLSVWFQHFHKDPSKSWKDITSELSGQFCASINFIDNSATVQPKYSFRSEGVIDGNSIRNESLFYASLPHESVCTENLTPWKKLLPCFRNKGMATLLNSGHIFNTFYFSLAMDFRPICRDISCELTSVESVQSISVVFNPPIMFDGKPSWSLIKLFGTTITSVCELSSATTVYVDITNSEKSNHSKLQPEPSRVTTTKSFDLEERKYAIYDINHLVKQVDTNKPNGMKGLNIGHYFQNNYVYTPITRPPLYATRFIRGYGLSSGGIICHIYNKLNTPTQIVYLDIIPWYLRMYFHTLRITSNNKIIEPHTVYYKPAKDRVQPHHLELLLVLPPNSMTEISFEFDRVFLKWTEYPPDANHGVYVNSAIISANLNTNSNYTSLPITDSQSSKSHYFVRIHTEILLVSLPTPDFSMPYNVICLVSTVVSLAFGPIHNLTTRRPRIVSKTSEVKSNRFIAKIKTFFRKKSAQVNETEQQN